MRYRKLDKNGDMTFGRGQADYFRDVPEAPAQAVWTRLALRLGEWFRDTSAGTPWDTEILGAHTQSTRDFAIRDRIENTAGILSLDGYQSTFNPNTRTFTVQATVTTVYGRAVVYLSSSPLTPEQIESGRAVSENVRAAVYGQLNFENPFQSGWL